VIGADLATQAHDFLIEVTDIALRLARQGRRVRIVTDHGWLLMPGGLPQAESDCLAVSAPKQYPFNWQRRGAWMISSIR
jgi:hypothetical protein